MALCMVGRKKAERIGWPEASRIPVVTTRMYSVCWRSSSSDSTWSVFAATSHVIWLIPVTFKSGTRTRKTLELSTLAGSIGPVNGIEIRGCRLKPSSVLSTSMSAQSDGRTAQSGFGRSTRRPVFCEKSKSVQRLLGNGAPSGLDRSKRGETPAACASDGNPRKTRNASSTARCSDM